MNNWGMNNWDMNNLEIMRLVINDRAMPDWNMSFYKRYLHV